MRLLKTDTSVLIRSSKLYNKLPKEVRELDVDVDVDWRGFGGRDLIPTHRKIS
jgi:hypothetical protein